MLALILGYKLLYIMSYYHTDLNTGENQLCLWILRLYSFFFYNSFIFDSAGSLLCCRLFSSRSDQGLLSSCGAQVSHCGGFSCGVRALGHADFSSCSTWAQ